MKFFEEIGVNQEYAVLSVTLELLELIKDGFINEKHYTLHYIKQNNPALKEDEVLSELYKEKSKLMRKINKREQEVNHK